VAAVTGTRPDEAGLASGLINTAQQVGGALGLAILAAVANGRTSDVLASGVRNPAVALTEGFQDAFLVGAGFAILGAVLTVVMISSRDSREHAAAAQRGEAQPAAAAA
jgi:sugar phosphate permease